MNILEQIQAKNDEFKLSYDDDSHTYYWKEGELKGITPIVGTVFPFNQKLIARQVAKAKGVSKEEILVEWSEKTRFGSLVHSRLEHMVQNNWEQLEKDDLDHDLVYAVKPIMYGLEHIASEIQIASPIMGLSTRIDFMGYLTNKFTGEKEIITINYKTSKSLANTNSKDYGIGMFDTYSNNGYNKLAIQSQIERLILKGVYGIDVKHISGLHIPVIQADSSYNVLHNGEFYDGLLYRLDKYKNPRNGSFYKVAMIDVPTDYVFSETLSILKNLKAKPPQHSQSDPQE